MNSEIDRFWSMILSDDCLIQREGYREWREFDIKYPQYLEDIKNKFSKKFYKTYKQMNFHDFHFYEVMYIAECFRNAVIKLTLYDYYENYGENTYFQLVYRNIQSYILNVPSPIHGIIWGNDIFEISGNDAIRHRIICANGANIEIVFKKVSLIKFNGKPQVP